MSLRRSRNRLQTRRTFLKTTAAAIAGATLFDVEKLFAITSHVRLDVGPLTAASPDLVSYAKAIKAMQALPVADPLSWAYQAAIHGTTLSGSHVAWNTCQHGTIFFWSWHRMYLYWFERIIRKMSGNPNFALPYWNYESAGERHLPAPFRNSASSLYTVNRGTGWNAGTASLPSSAVATGPPPPGTGFMPTIPYYPAQSGCESTPHATVHVTIGSWMGVISTAAQDPIFYLHHANIDRLWNLWLKQGGGRSDPLTDNTWKTTKWTFFDESGTEVHMTSCDVLRAAEQLDYVYQNEGTQAKEYCPKVLPFPIWEVEAIQPLPAIKLPPGPDPVPFRVDISQFAQRLKAMQTDPKQELALDLTGVEADRQPNVYWEVYVAPPGAKPNPESESWIGNVALFGHGIHDEHQHGEFQPAEFSFPIARALGAAAAKNANEIQLTFVPRGALISAADAAQAQPNESTLTVGKAEIVSRRLTTRQP